ncbi:MAG: arginase family protein [Fimbriiglobus sp.]|jgi:arginase family enzyme|nr:arginase family protein [Fimbriiglobus sp.]
MSIEGRKTSVIVFPFDLFGNAGTGAGAERLGDFVGELLDDNRHETRSTRCDAYRGRVKVKEFAFDTLKAVQSWRHIGRQTARQCLKSGERVIWLGGNHLSVLPVYEELGTDTLVFQFDAHFDIYQLHDVTPNLANGNFLLHAETTLPPIVNVGHRDLFLTPAEIRDNFVAAYSSLDIANDIERFAKEIRKRSMGAKRVWIDIDADVFDPANVPAVHHPLPFGPSPLLVLKLLDAAFAGNVVGVSVSEFDPWRDTNDAGLNVLGWLIEWVLLRWYEGGEE